MRKGEEEKKGCLTFLEALSPVRELSQECPIRELSSDKDFSESRSAASVRKKTHGAARGKLS